MTETRTHLTVYNFRRKLPDISPAKSVKEDKPLRAESLARQSIVSSADAPRAPQMIFHPAPELKPQLPQPLPNLIALAAPPPPRREFQAPPSVQRNSQSVSIPELAPAPEIGARAAATRQFDLPKPARPFVLPPERPRTFVAKLETPTLAPELAPDQPSLGAAAQKTLTQGSRTLAFRPNAAPSTTHAMGEMQDAPALDTQSTSKANLAIVGLNAVDTQKIDLPDGSRKASFAGGPKLNPNGALSAGRNSGITIPDVTVRGGDREAQPTMLARAVSPAYNSPSSLESIRAAVRESARSDAPAPGEIGQGGGARVSGAPDPRFLGRQVFSVAIQSPNLTSHQGSWLMWYAEHVEVASRALISAPQPLHKVDPKYISTAAEERVEGVVRLAFVISREGRVSGVDLVKGIDERLDRSAVEALAKWQFSPAMKEGRPVEVDALVEIPFRLAPRFEK